MLAAAREIFLHCLGLGSIIIGRALESALESPAAAIELVSVCVCESMCFVCVPDFQYSSIPSLGDAVFTEV